MLTKLFTLENIGLFKNGTPQPLIFSKVNLIYAENGRGKTTLTTVLRSCTENDSAILSAKKTLDLTALPKVGMLAGTSPISFDNGVWSGQLPSIAIFDVEFVERNVYTGQEVRPNQRQSLLEFVLGDSAVALKQDVDRLTTEGAEATKSRGKAEDKLNAYRGTLPLKDFRALLQNPNVEAELEDLYKQIGVARQQNGILKRPDLIPLMHLTFDLDPIFTVLNATLAGIEQAAEAMVKAHIAKHKHEAGFESWVSQGQAFVELDLCPFCGQELSGLELIQAYQGYFNTEYRALKGNIGGLQGAILSKLSDGIVQSINQVVDTNAERVASWDEELKLTIPLFDKVAGLALLTKVREELLGFSRMKNNTPLDSIGTDKDKTAAVELISKFNDLLDSYNTALNLANGQITEFKTKLAATDIAKLDVAVKLLEAQKIRHSAEIVETFSECDAAETQRKELEQKKTAARSTLDALMATTLSQYRDAINHWLLVKFGAAFSIEEMKPAYIGGGLPRTEYGLRVREKSVKLGARETNGPSFGNTLSEGDKRTLAYAFFLAQLFQRSDKSSLIVVIDDPVSSLDKNRRTQTKYAIGRVAREVEQVIVLSHDAYFLRDLERYLTGKVKISSTVKEVRRVENEYSTIDDCDLDHICASDYYHHYVSVHEFAEGVGTRSTREVSKDLRLLLEGHLHRRFPKHVKEGLTLGMVIESIRTAATGSPLESLKARVPDLVDFNDFASRYHHDTNPTADTEAITDAELLIYAKQALKLIHTGGF